MTLEQRVAGLPADQRALLAHRLRQAGALAGAAEPAAGKLLVAYVTCRPGHGADPDGLRRFLRAQLPAPMVPATVVVLDELPVTASGKVDRLALPVPQDSHGEATAAAMTPEERALAGLWAEVLGLPAVGVDEDFFALGGNSILLLKLCARARELGLALTPRDLFEHPTIAELAARPGGR